MRVTATVALILGAAGLLGYLHLLGKGPFASFTARHLRALKDRVDPPTRVEPVTIQDIEALPQNRSAAEYSGTERRGVTIEGYVQLLKRAPDDDHHLELVLTPRGSGGPDTNYVTAEITPAFRRGSTRWRWDALVAAFRPNHGGVTPWGGGPRRARITGWLLYDYRLYSRPNPRWRAPRLSAWEVHPVTRIELWDDSLARYVEYAP
jgi:hypothetical protein